MTMRRSDSWTAMKTMMMAMRNDDDGGGDDEMTDVAVVVANDSELRGRID